MKGKSNRISRNGLGQLTIPVIALTLLVIFNLIRDPGFFSIGILSDIQGLQEILSVL